MMAKVLGVNEVGNTALYLSCCSLSPHTPHFCGQSVRQTTPLGRLLPSVLQARCVRLSGSACFEPRSGRAAAAQEAKAGQTDGQAACIASQHERTHTHTPSGNRTNL